MGFVPAVQKGFQNYAQFSGRASRSEFWWFMLATSLATAVASTIDRVAGMDFLMGYGPFYWISVAAFLVPQIAVGVRRLHDIGKAGIMYLLIFIPLIGIILLIVWWVGVGDAAQNEYGDVPTNVA